MRSDLGRALGHIVAQARSRIRRGVVAQQDSVQAAEITSDELRRIDIAPSDLVARHGGEGAIARSSLAAANGMVSARRQLALTDDDARAVAQICRLEDEAQGVIGSALRRSTAGPLRKERQHSCKKGVRLITSDIMARVRDMGDA